ncbi:hypothetical protein L1987_55324 [Smallanthus sonchifolius]|uniref:Uncharacterized protein n=1 Tax=Smallanthus sonchifolius TaxID=185202 RepID=A0ACB9E9P5_9ASTR|nr:hypothetical protein L1987_55324 [Smallanthus sonchifolius]
MASSTEIAHDFTPFIRVYNDGRVERLLTAPRLPPSTDPVTGVQSKDIVISSDPEVKSRIFLPKINPEHPPKKLPLIIYVHGGGFCIGSPINIVTQAFLTPLVSQTPAVAISIGYRLAPEHPLPTAYHDCWDVFQWIASHAAGSGPDQWINDYVDTGRVLLVGESAGANLAHYIAVQAGVNKTSLGIRGLIALHPYFSHKEPDNLIKFLYPTSSGTDDDPKLNPCSDPDLEKMGCSRVLIVVAEKDSLKPRGVGYKETLERSKWGGKVEFIENEGEDHCFYLFDPSSEKAKGLFQTLVSFINQVI